MPDSRTKPETMHEALIRLHEELPSIGKDQEADTGKYTYKFVSLTTVNEIVLPLLAGLGLSWFTAPTTLDGAAVLHYRLSCEGQVGTFGGGSIEGYYPLGSTTQPPQALGSAITYARRYALLAVTGIAPADDDGKAASAPPEMPELQDPPTDWRKRVDAVKTLPELSALYDAEAHRWFTEEVKLAFTARKVILGG